MRSRLVTLMLLGVAAALLPGHSPYRQWYAYRAAHLVVVTDEMRPGADVASAAVQAYAAPTCITALFAARERPLRHLIAVPSGGARTPSGHAAPGPGARECEPGAVCSAASGNS